MGDAEDLAAVVAEVARRFPGVRLAPGFVAGAVPPGAATLQRRADACYAAFQNADIADSSPEGCLPDRPGGSLPRGVYVLQADETYDVGESERERMRAVSDLGVVPSSEEDGAGGEGGAGSSFLGGPRSDERRHVDVKGDALRRGRTLKVVLRDGRGRRAVAVERVACPSLSVRRPAGYKVRLTDPEVSAGVILLRPESLAVLGGKVQALEDAKVRAITKANAPRYHSDTGRRLRGVDNGGGGGERGGSAGGIAGGRSGPSPSPGQQGTAPRQQGMAPRQQGTAPRQQGTGHVQPQVQPRVPAAVAPATVQPRPPPPRPVVAPVPVQPRAATVVSAGGGGWGVDEWDDYAEEEEEAMRLLAAAETQWESQHQDQTRGVGPPQGHGHAPGPPVDRNHPVKQETVSDVDFEEEEAMRLLAAAETQWEAQQRRQQEQEQQRGVGPPQGHGHAPGPPAGRDHPVKQETVLDVDFEEEEEAMRLLAAAETQWEAQQQRQRGRRPQQAAPGAVAGAIDLTAD